MPSRIDVIFATVGAGKTTLLTKTIEGDQQTRRDSDRIAATGVQVAQINTGKGCHLVCEDGWKGARILDLGEKGAFFLSRMLGISYAQPISTLAKEKGWSCFR
jgi:hydrogenase nickel incorporation protein HypB